MNDIICYIAQKKITYSDGRISYTDNVITHSAIITKIGEGFDVLDKSTYSELTVISKWGEGGLYEHNVLDCPYIFNSVEERPNIGEVKLTFYDLIIYTPRTTGSYNLSDYTNTINESAVIDMSSEIEDSYEMYELNVSYTKYYDFNIMSSSKLNVRLYDEHMQLVSIFDLDSDNYVIRFIEPLISGKRYYLRVAYRDISSYGTINTKIISRNTQYITSNSETDILLNYLNGINYYNVNNLDVGFYDFKLTASDLNGNEIEYPLGAITIKDEDGIEVIDKFSLNEYENKAVTKVNKNSLSILLDTTGYYRVYINLDTDNLSSIILEITPVSHEVVNLFNFDEDTYDPELIIDNEVAEGDYFKEIILKQPGLFLLSYELDYTNDNKVLFVFGKLNYNETTYKYTYETIYTSLNRGVHLYEEVYSLEEGSYFIGYFNKHDNSGVDVTFGRIVTKSGSSNLTTDPEDGTDCGSQINIVEKYYEDKDKTYRGNTILEGFTRIIYLTDSTSRSEYSFYSSNEDVATVSPHGLVLGLKVTENTIVKVMVINNNDPSIVYVKEFVIINDTETSNVYVDIQGEEHSLSDGAYLLNLNALNCPYPYIQYYDFTTYILDQVNENFTVKLDEWGYLTSTGPGMVYITGTYRLNPRFVVTIYLRLVE